MFTPQVDLVVAAVDLNNVVTNVINVVKKVTYQGIVLVALMVSLKRVKLQ